MFLNKFKRFIEKIAVDTTSNLIATVLILVVPQILGTIISKLSNSRILSLNTVLGAVLISSLIFNWRQIIEKRRLGNKKISPVLADWEDYREIMTLKHINVLWSVRIPYLEYDFSHESRNTLPEDIRIAPKPICPKCQTNLIENKGRLFSKYVWKCINCGFKNKVQRSFKEASEEIRIIAQGKCRREKWEY